MLLRATPMPRLSIWGPLILVGLWGCDHDVPEARTARHEHHIAIDDCIANIEVYPAGGPLPQPYRVLAPVDAGFVGNWGWTSTSRFKRMKKRACELGADAIIDADDSGPGSRVTTTYQYDQYGRPVAVVQEGSRDAKRSTALAVQFVGPQAAAPEVVVAPEVVGPPQVVVALPVVAPPQVVVTPQVVVR
jgi:hypothetical protein